MRNILRWWNHS